ncbi:MAG: hypothetical protein Q7R94_03095 [bacterium]|nr:hypothetical protein [bacterium]
MNLPYRPYGKENQMNRVGKLFSAVIFCFVFVQGLCAEEYPHNDRIKQLIAEKLGKKFHLQASGEIRYSDSSFSDMIQTNGSAFVSYRVYAGEERRISLGNKVVMSVEAGEVIVYDKYVKRDGGTVLVETGIKTTVMRQCAAQPGGSWDREFGIAVLSPDGLWLRESTACGLENYLNFSALYQKEFPILDAISWQRIAEAFIKASK